MPLFNPAPALAFGLVASRQSVPTSAPTSRNQQNARTRHFAYDAITAIQVRYSNWYADPATSTELNPGASFTLTLGVEYPVGTFTQMTFGGSASGSCADGADLVSDIVTLSVPVPKGATFYLRPCLRSTGAVCSMAMGLCPVASSGEFYQYATSGLTDTSLGGTITTTASGSRAILLPTGIYAQTAVRSAAAVGDSKCAGNHDYPFSTQDLSGNLERSLGRDGPVVNLGLQGDTVNSAITNYTKRLVLASFASAIACNYGTNDLVTLSRTGAQVFADLQTFAALFGSRPFYPATIGPRTDTAGAVLSSEANRQALNALIRPCIPPFAGVFDIDAFEAVPSNNGKWRLDTTRTVADLSATNASATITSATAIFTVNDIGAAVSVAGAGAAGALYVGSIASITNTTTALLNANAQEGLPSTTVTNAVAQIGLPWLDGIHEPPQFLRFLENSGVVSIARAPKFAGTTLPALPSLSIGYGSAGLYLGPSVNGSFGAIYSSGVTPAATNYALDVGTATTVVNAPTTLNLAVNNTTVAAVTSSLFQVKQHLDINVAGKGLQVAEGSNAKQGTATLVAGVATVANTSVTASSRIFLTAQSLGTIALPASLGVTARTAGTSFTITSSQITDTSVVAYEIFEPG